MLKQIDFEEWEKGDYRAFAEINRTLDDLFKKFNFHFEEFDSDGLGKAKMAYLLTPSKKQFLVIEYLETRVPLINIFLLNNPQTLPIDLREILESLNLEFSDLSWIDESINRN